MRKVKEYVYLLACLAVVIVLCILSLYYDNARNNTVPDAQVSVIVDTPGIILDTPHISAPDELPIPTPSTTPLSAHNIIKSDMLFTIYDITQNGQPEYMYEIYNLAGNTVKSDKTWRINPSIKYVSGDNYLSITTSAGTGFFFTQFYDIHDDLFSEEYTSPIAADFGYVAYLDEQDGQLILVVRDVMDTFEYYAEVELGEAPIVPSPFHAADNAEFLDESTLVVIYYYGEDYCTKTITLDLTAIN